MANHSDILRQLDSLSQNGPPFRAAYDALEEKLLNFTSENGRSATDDDIKVIYLDLLIESLD